MNKIEVVETLSELTSLPKKDSKIVVDAVLEAIKRGLSADGKVVLTGFGKFMLVNRQARVGRNPRTGESVDVPAKSVIRFKPSMELKGLI